MSSIIAKVFGPFRMETSEGVDLTPKGQKNRAICAILALSKDQIRSRQWLRECLWENPTSTQAQYSLRTSLRAIRTSLGDHAHQLHSDKWDVWFKPQISVSLDRTPGSELLENLDIATMVFEDWIRAVRSSFSETQTNRLIIGPIGDEQPVVRIFLRSTEEGSKAAPVLRTLCDTLSHSLIKIDNLHIEFVNSEDDLHELKDDKFILVEMESSQDDQILVVNARLLGPPNLSYIWSGKTHVAAGESYKKKLNTIEEFSNKILTAILEKASNRISSEPFFQLTNATRRLFTGDHFDLQTAERILTRLRAEKPSGAVHAWLAYLRLTESFEFLVNSESNHEEALNSVMEALKAAPYSPMVVAISAQVALKLSGDVDYSRHLAARAMDLAEGDAFALDAMSQVKTFLGDHTSALEFAKRAQAASRGLANEFSWDMLCCMAALGVGDYNEAIEFAASCHRKEPSYRPALRYLIALHLILNRREEAEHFIQKLRCLEPDFDIASMRSPDYPMETLRILGLIDALPDHIDP